MTHPNVSQWFRLYNLLKQGDRLKDQNGTQASADNLAECKSQLYRYIIESIPNDAGGKLLVGQLDRVHGDNGPAAYRYLENKSTVGGNVTRIRNTRGARSTPSRRRKRPIIALLPNGTPWWRNSCSLTNSCPPSSKRTDCPSRRSSWT
eukprot:6213270-Pleurochrysis_carterae.AAC.1